MAQAIHLSGKHGAGRFALVDDEDYGWLNAHLWFMTSDGYAATSAKSDGKNRIVLMHRLIMRPESGLVVNHINGIRRDNRNSNLENVTPKVNRIKQVRPKWSSRWERRTHMYLYGDLGFYHCLDLIDDAMLIHLLDGRAIYPQPLLTPIKLGEMAAARQFIVS